MDQATEALIKLEGVSKVFYTDEVETHALATVHLEIGRGEYISIAGPSGCGKTTLLSLLGLLDTPSEGKYFLDGKDVSNLTASERARIRNREIGFIFQAFNLIGDLNVYENVELPLTYRGMLGERTALAEALERSAFAPHEHYPSSCQAHTRVAVARPLSTPLILLATSDGNLTPRLRSRDGSPEELYAYCATICLVTHDPRYARYADRTFIFHGQVVRDEESPRTSSRSVFDVHTTVTFVGKNVRGEVSPRPIFFSSNPRSRSVPVRFP